jgi:hypothetical protein
MNKTKYLYFSFQSSQNFEPNSNELASFQRKYKKDFKTRELYEGEELSYEYRIRGWKHPRYSHIISMIVAFEVEDKLRIKYITGKEIDILMEFNNILRKSQDYEIVSFDNQIILPFLGIRMARNAMFNANHIGIRYKNCRPWDVKAIDFQQYYDGAGNYKSSLKDIAEDLGLDFDDIVEIEDEFTFYNVGDLETLKKSAIQKVEVISKAHRLLLDLPKLETVLIEEKVEDVVEEKPKNILLELFNDNSISKESAEVLKEKIGKKKLTKKDKENLFTILRAVLIKNDFINGQQDTKAVTARKEGEVTDFINSL